VFNAIKESIVAISFLNIKIALFFVLLVLQRFCTRSLLAMSLSISTALLIDCRGLGKYYTLSMCSFVTTKFSTPRNL
jgi:hypothetical protein